MDPAGAATPLEPLRRPRARAQAAVHAATLLAADRGGLARRTPATARLRTASVRWAGAAGQRPEHS